MGADVVETALQLVFLLVFALVAAGYVMKLPGRRVLGVRRSVVNSGLVGYSRALEAG